MSQNSKDHVKQAGTSRRGFLKMAAVAYLGHVSWCFPYFPDCVSISATGRHSPERFVIQAAILPTAVFMMI